MPDLSGRHRKTLRRIFERPTPVGIRWAEAVALLEAVGAELEERAGSRVAIVLGGRVAIVHKPHPRPELPRQLVRRLAQILEENGIRPDESG